MKVLEAVKEPSGRQLLYEHAKDQLESAEATQDTVRDKAKQLLGTVSFTLALMSASLVLVREWHATVPLLATVGILALFFWVIAHFVRALILSIQAITRDEVVGVSTQQIAKVLKASSGDYANNAVYTKLASAFRAAASQTRRRTLDSVNRVILAQRSFLWGLILLPATFLLYVSLTLVYVPSKTPTVPEQLPRTEQPVDIHFGAMNARIDSLGDSFENLSGEIRGAVRHVEEHIAELTDKVDALSRGPTSEQKGGE